CLIRLYPVVVTIPRTLRIDGNCPDEVPPILAAASLFGLCALPSSSTLDHFAPICEIISPEGDAAGMPFLPAYLDAVGAPSFHKGCNFAAAGSTIQPATASSLCPFSFGVQ
ncbi:GDSL esterase/lipase-like protein, partial [Drosera capensis]